ncbi:polysaccharide pyruvyl transferase family protein [Cupriavidus pauculus]|nr:polysaccharide pyruvyl transferase family protein [Cupriavidus pauculus]
MILFGAFDRHNFGDLLLPHVMAHRLASRQLRYAGLVQRDLRGDGGHRVEAITRLNAAMGDSAVDILHVGGEILTCSAWEAAVMLLPTEPARSVVAQLDAQLQERTAWAQALLGLTDRAPYLLPAQLFANARHVAYQAVGGFDLDRIEPAMRGEVVAKLKSATHISVRDQQTHAILSACGIASDLTPDPAVMVAELFGAHIEGRCRRGKLAGLLSAFPGGYLAMQFAAEFGDDQTLMQLASQIQRITQSTGLGLVLFRAGAAPWHDDLSSYRRLVALGNGASIALFTSLNLWDICAVIARSRGFIGSSLHGSIVAAAYALPCLGLLRPGQLPQTSKQAAFWSTWSPGGLPAAVPIEALADRMRQAMATDPVERAKLAKGLVNACRPSFFR